MSARGMASEALAYRLRLKREGAWYLRYRAELAEGRGNAEAAAIMRARAAALDEEAAALQAPGYLRVEVQS